MDLEIFGIATCDTCRKARRWLGEQGVEHRFIDLRKDGVTRGQISAWLSAVGVERLVNRRSTTWRGLSPASRTMDSADEAVTLLLEHPTLIKRPVFVSGEEILVGFDDGVRARLSPGDRS